MLDPARGMRLNQDAYLHDFAKNRWVADGSDCWKLERRQDFRESGFPSWEAFRDGDWERALLLYEEQRPALRELAAEATRHRSAFRRIRVVEEPVTPYLQWELHCLKVRAECGEQIRVIPAEVIAEHENSQQLPELVSLCGKVLYQTLYTTDGSPDGGIRYSEPRIVAAYEGLAASLYQAGEDVLDYFARKTANLPAPVPARGDPA